MRSNLMKFFAMVLAAALLTVAVFSGIAIVFLIDQDLYEQTPEQADRDFLEAMTYEVAYNYALEWIAMQEGMTEEEAAMLLDTMYVPYYITDRVLEVAFDAVYPGHTEGVFTFTHSIAGMLYPVAVAEGEKMPDTDAVPVYTDTTKVYTDNGRKTYTMLYYYAPPMTVTVTMSMETTPVLELVNFIYTLRHHLPLICIVCALLGLLCVVYLCCAAGKQKGCTGIRPGGLNRLPLDLYGLAVGFIIFRGLWLLVQDVLPALYGEYYWAAAILSLGMGFVLCLLVIGLLFAFAAQVKANGFWWRHSAIGWCLLHIFHGIRFCWRGLRAIFRLLPVIWQWLLTAAGMVLGLSIAAIPAFYVNSYIRSEPFFVLIFLGVVVVCIAIICYGGYCFGTILKAAKEMAKGNLNYKVNTRFFVGAFKDCGENLNSLSSAAMVAAQQQMKSERMKTELITNVSHDIKTPLTSIINYVDLLQKPHTEEEGEQYLDVLTRQSQRLKKLTEDLVEMSKAATGNVAVELTALDAGETVLQALGEFGDKLDSVPLSIVFRQPQEPVWIHADGRLTWRVMSNLLSNAVKYAQPGTRLYVDILETEDQVRISFKNMSREQLNVTADELMERFVRGDASRNTEGSGLGLNIAQSLMQVQQGDLQLLIDGDLFKVTLIFPGT